MKKKYLTLAGIGAAATLGIIFISILATGTFTLFPTAAIDPIPDHAAGDLVVIRGTTNCPADTRLILEVRTFPFVPAEQPVSRTDAYIVRGGNISNTWSGALDTSALAPGEYLVNAYWMDENYARSSLLASTRFRLTNATTGSSGYPGTGANDSASFIHIDFSDPIYRGEKVLISGTTNLPRDSGLIYHITQQSNTSLFTVDLKTGKQVTRGEFARSGVITLQPEDHGVRRWSFAIDSTEFIPDRYDIIVTEDNISTNEIGKTGIFGTASFTVLEADLCIISPTREINVSVKR